MSNDTLRVKPADGLIVRDPVTAKPLPTNGSRVPNTSYWRRRLATGDVTSAPAKATRKPSKTNDEA